MRSARRGAWGHGSLAVGHERETPWWQGELTRSCEGRQACDQPWSRFSWCLRPRNAPCWTRRSSARTSRGSVRPPHPGIAAAGLSRRAGGRVFDGGGGGGSGPGSTRRLRGLGQEDPRGENVEGAREEAVSGARRDEEGVPGGFIGWGRGSGGGLLPPGRVP